MFVHVCACLSLWEESEHWVGVSVCVCVCVCVCVVVVVVSSVCEVDWNLNCRCTEWAWDMLKLSISLYCNFMISLTLRFSERLVWLGKSSSPKNMAALAVKCLQAKDRNKKHITPLIDWEICHLKLVDSAAVSPSCNWYRCPNICVWFKSIWSWD